jgi:6-phosphogluconate dehydrogenase
MDEARVEVVVKFRHHTPCLCPPEANKHFTNILRYQVQPHERISTSFWAKKPGSEMVIEEKEFSFDYEHAFSGSEFLDAYAKLLRDAIEGNQTSFVSTEEITASWKFIDPIISAWQSNAVPLITYPKGVEAHAISDLDVKQTIPKKEIAYIGLGKMGANMVERLLDHGWDVTAFDPSEDARKKVEVLGAKVVSSASSIASYFNSETPRIIWVMVPHSVVDDVLKELAPNLKKGDIIIDGGNSFYKDSIRRGEELKKLGIHYLDVGVSGGPSGARNGACLMIGGEKTAYKELVGLFSDISVAGGYDYMGELGAGHFVKMIHNGIEYGMMQAIAEGFAVMQKWREGLDLERIAHLYNNGSVIESRLVYWLKEAYRIHGTQLSDISGTVAHSGEGDWTVQASKELGIPVPVIESALQFRIDSEKDPSYTGQIVSALRNQFGGHDVKKN